MPGDWYEIVKGQRLSQGEILFDLPLPISRDDLTPGDVEGHLKDNKPLEIGVLRQNFVVLTQSCDLDKDRKRKGRVVLAPLTSLTDFKAAYPAFKNAAFVEMLRRGGTVMGSFMLKSFATLPALADHQVVDLINIGVAPRSFVDKFIGEKDQVRLLPPYIELLSHAFAHTYSRVAVPEGGEVAAFASNPVADLGWQ